MLYKVFLLSCVGFQKVLQCRTNEITQDTDVPLLCEPSLQVTAFTVYFCLETTDNVIRLFQKRL